MELCWEERTEELGLWEAVLAATVPVVVREVVAPPVCAAGAPVAGGREPVADGPAGGEPGAVGAVGTGGG
jgi:hypothetical protein